jgi:uncharacterized protein YecT (DUF1311 family)
MKTFVLMVVMLCSFPGLSSAETQLEMNEGAVLSYRKADARLNQVYQKILVRYAKNPLFIRNLKESQRLWVRFRDAQLAMKYPERGAGYYGSVLPMCKAYYLSVLTERRVRELEEWLTDHKDGDVCSGTIGEYGVAE